MLSLWLSFKHKIRPQKRNNQNYKYLNNTTPLPLYICETNKWTTKKSNTQFGKNPPSKYIEEYDYNEDVDVSIPHVLFSLGIEAEKRERNWSV